MGRGRDLPAAGVSRRPLGRMLSPVERRAGVPVAGRRLEVERSRVGAGGTLRIVAAACRRPPTARHGPANEMSDDAATPSRGPRSERLQKMNRAPSTMTRLPSVPGGREVMRP